MTGCGRAAVRPVTPEHAMPSIKPCLLPAIAAGVAFVSLPAAAQQPQAELHIDVATHSAPGMPGAGAAGRLAGMMGGAKASYGMARHPAMPGKYLDLALYNRNRPGTPARQAIPDGARMGPHLDLLPPPRPVETARDANPIANATGQADGGRGRILYYWGCGETVGAGQPREFSFEVRDGEFRTTGDAPAPRAVADAGISAGPEYGLWPNDTHGPMVPADASLRGGHHVTGEALPDSMRFELQQAHDFMPALDVERSGSAADGITLQWQPVDGARAYFLHAMGSRGDDTMVMWSSSEVGNAGPELITYLSSAQADRWVGEKVLLDRDARSCTIPREVFAGDGTAVEPMVQMVAYGGDSTIQQPRPADAPAGWAPEWQVRVRNKSTAMLVPGMEGMAVPDARDVAEETGKDQVKRAARGLLRGILGR